MRLKKGIVVIGQWNNEGVVCAILPKCLQLGSNPPPIGKNANDIFPVYQGTIGNVTESIFDYITQDVYEDGVLKLSNSNPAFGPRGLRTNPNYAITQDSALTAVCWYGRFPGPSDPGLKNPWQLRQLPSTDATAIYPYYIPNSNTLGLAHSDMDDQLSSNNQFYGYFDPTVKTQPSLMLGLMKPAGSLALTGYVNGELVDSFYFEQVPPITQPFSMTLNYINLANNRLNFGEVQAFIVYNRVLPEAELDQLYALGPTLGGLRGYDNGDGSLELIDPNASNDPPQQTELNAKFNLVQNTTDIQNNIVKIKNPHIAPSGNVVGQKEDYLFNY